MKPTTTAFLIDDDTDDHDIFSYAMEKADSSVKCVFANDGVNALEKINTEKNFIPDFIFIDMNMPRMNGQQCLKELKKIDRLKETPVFMYSTSADPAEIEENLKLGATDFILKPSDIKDLTAILGKIVARKIAPLLFILSAFLFIPGKSFAQHKAENVSSADSLKKLSVEELMNLLVTSVSKTPEKFSEIASAIQVITGEEIRRSGTLRLPGALRLATNLQVSASGAHDTRVTSRGFNGYPVANSSLANKLLVMIDGRSVYTPLFGGVYWDVQNILQENIKQIEVISGPGGALWGANSVNGIVNVISKPAKETQGVYASVAAGLSLQDFGAVQFGSHVDTTFYYRAYVQRYDYKSTTLANGEDARDAWNITQAGFRTDYYPSAKSMVTVQGDLYAGNENDTGSTYINGQNVIGRWSHNYTETSGIIFQAYFDRTYRHETGVKNLDELYTYDLDFQHNFKIGGRNKFIWGLGYRVANDNFTNAGNTFIPPDRTLHWYSGFVQDQFTIVPEKLDFTIGTKILHNDFTGVEYHPTARLAWIPNRQHTIWAAVSQGVRTPSRLETDLRDTSLGVYGDFQSEKVIAYELGYRIQPRQNISISLAGFYNNYRDLRSVDLNDNAPPHYYFANNLSANTYGVEFSAKAIATKWWKIRGGYTFLQEDFDIKSDKTLDLSIPFEATDPEHQFLVQSLMDIYKFFQLDVTLRYVSSIPQQINVPEVDSYFTFDVRVAWEYKWFTWSIVGQNLAEATRKSGTIEVPRSGFTKLSVRF
jgi:iron complex outermembrane receptor protein